MRSREFQNILVKCSETLCVTLLHQEAWGTTQGLSCPVPSSPVPAMVHTEHAYRDCTVKICVLPTPSLCMHVSSPYYGVPVLYHCLDFALNRSMRGVRCGPGGATVDLRWARAERRKKEEEENNRAALTILFCTDATQQIRGRLWTVDDPSVPERSQSHGSTLTHCCFFSTHVGVIDRPVVNVRGDKLLLNVLKLRGAEQMSRKFCDCLLTEWTLHLNTHTLSRHIRLTFLQPWDANLEQNSSIPDISFRLT